MDLLCLDILNSDRVDWQTAVARRDMLDDAAWLVDVLRKYCLAAEGPPPDALRHDLKRLRSHMRRIVMALPSGLAPQSDLDACNAVLASISVHFRLVHRDNAYSLDHVYDSSGWPLILWQVANSFAELVATRDSARVKICDNDNCGWVFVDASRNKARRWCDEKVCGNIMKVRRFRQRQKGGYA